MVIERVFRVEILAPACVGRAGIYLSGEAAHPLTAQIKAEIAEQVRVLYPKAEKIVVTEVADPSVIGGVQIKLANQQLDLSVEAKLNKFKQLTGAGKE